MSERKCREKLKSEELFDKLLEESKKNQEVEKTQLSKLIDNPSVIRNDAYTKIQTELHSHPPEYKINSSFEKMVNTSQEKIFNYLYQERTAEPVEEEAPNHLSPERTAQPVEKETLHQLPPERTAQPVEKETLRHLSTERTAQYVKETTQHLSPEKTSERYQDAISINFNSSEERGTMTESPLLDKAESSQFNKALQNEIHSINEPLHFEEEHILPSVDDNPEQNDIFNQNNNQAVRYYSLSGVQCLDQAVENIVIDKNDKIVLGGSENVITDTYFKKGSHLGIKMSPINVQKSNNHESDKPDVTKLVVNKSSETRENVDNASGSVVAQFLDEPPLTGTSKKNKFDGIFSLEGNSGTEINNLDSLSTISNNPVFSSPKLKTYPDIYLHKDKINILRQMSQVFNNEKSQETPEIVDKSSQNVLAAETNVFEKTHATNEIDKHTCTENKSNHIECINEITPQENVISNSTDLESLAPGPIHVVSNTHNNIEKKITVESFIGKKGENIDVIDGFAFISFASIDKLKIYKQKKKLSHNKFRFTHSKIYKRKLKQNLLNRKKLLMAQKTPIKSKVNGTAPESSSSETSKNHLKSDQDLSSTSDGKPDTTIKKPSFDCFKIPKIPCNSNPKKNRPIKELIANKKSNEENEILYLYFGGNLITLAGSINKISPLDTEPLKARMLLPTGMTYTDIKRKEAIRELRPIDINEDLATFALSALQTCKPPAVSLPSVNVLKDNSMNTVENISPKPIKMSNDIDKENGGKDEVETNNKENISTNNNEIENSSAIENQENKLSTNNVPLSKIKWTQADVIKSPVGSTTTDKSAASKRNIYRFPSLSREMKRLNMNFISYDKVIQEETSSCSKDKGTCYNEAHCKLGCICDSLKCRKIVTSHCGRIECMLECHCHIGNIGQKLMNMSRENSVSILNMDREHQSGLAIREKEFQKTVVQSGSDVFLVEREKRKRDIKLPERYRDSKESKSSQPTMTLPLEEFLDTIGVQVSHVLPEDYFKHVKRFKIELPWYKLPANVSVWCMFHKLYDCKCLLNAKDSNDCEGGFESLSSSDELSDGENDVKERIEVGTQSSAIICQRLVKGSPNCEPENGSTYSFKYWIHNGEHHSARTCGYEMKNMRFETIDKMPYHYPVPAKPLIMGMTAKISNIICTKNKAKFSNLKELMDNSSKSVVSPNSKPNLNVNTYFTNDRAIKNNNFAGTTKITKNFDENVYCRSICESIEASRNSLHMMIKEEEKRGELELDLVSKISGKTIIVSEPRFKKLMNMCIIGIVGLSNNHRCIISTVKSTEDLVKMQKIHQLIMNNTVDVGPHIKEIFFAATGNKYRYVMIRCDSFGRWEIVGVVQKKQSSVDITSPVKKNGSPKNYINSISDEKNYLNTTEANQFHSSKTSQDNQSSIINNSKTGEITTTNTSEAKQIDVTKISKTFQTEKYINELQNKNDNLPLITDVISGRDIRSLLVKDNNVSQRDVDHDSLLPLETQKSFIINPTGSKIFNNVKLNKSFKLDSVISNEQKLIIKSAPNKKTDILLTRRPENQKIIFVPGASNKKMRMVVVPVESESSNILVVPNPSSASNLTSTPVKSGYSYSNDISSHNLKKPNKYRPTILGAKQSRGIHLQENQTVKKVVFNLNTTTDNQPSCKDGDSVKECISNLPTINLNQSKLNLQTEEENKKMILSDCSSNLNDAESIYCEQVDNLLLNDAFNYLQENAESSIDGSLLNKSDDLDLRLDISSDGIQSDDDSHDHAYSSEKLKKKEIKTTSLHIPLRKSPVSPIKTTSLHINNRQVANNPELIFISSRKLEQCSCIDMSINFKSVKLHWLSGTINKVVLNTIEVQSKKRLVPISLVVESSGKMIKFYGQHCYLPGDIKIPILILGTNLSDVRQKSKLDIVSFFRSTPVKYVIQLKNKQFGTFMYDKSGLNLIKLKNFERNKGAIGSCDSNEFKIPVDHLRKPVRFRQGPNFNKSSRFKVMSTSNDPFNKPCASSTGRTGMVPVFICKPGIKKQLTKPKVGKSIKSNLMCSRKPTKELLFSVKRKMSTSDDGNMQNQKRSCDKGISAHLGKIEIPPVSLIQPETENIDAPSDISFKNEKLIDPSIEEIPFDPSEINPSNLFESGDRKAFGIACYDEKSLSNRMTIDETNIEPKLKSKVEMKSMDATKVRSSRKQSLSHSNLRDFDAGSESFDDSSSCSATDSISSKTSRRVPRLAKEHNLREKLRRKAQASLFSTLQKTFSNKYSPDCYEPILGEKISKGNILSKAHSIIKKEELLCKELDSKEMIMRTKRRHLMSRMGKLYFEVPEKVQEDIIKLLKNDLVNPSEKEEFIRNYKPQSLILDDGNIKVKENGIVSFYWDSKPLLD